MHLHYDLLHLDKSVTGGNKGTHERYESCEEKNLDEQVIKLFNNQLPD